MESAPVAHPNPGLARFTRWQAAAFHASVSAAVGAVALALVLGVWFPDELFRIAGGSELVMILVGVDLVLGPLLTLIVFDARKRLLKLDLVLIGGLQLAALCYGTFVMFEARPAYLVFVVDRFDVVSTIDVDAGARAAAAHPEFRGVNLGRPRLAAAALPTDPAHRNQVVMAAAGGVDLLLTPRYWVPFDQARTEVLRRAKPLAELRAVDPAVNGPAFDAALAALGRPAESLRGLGIMAKHGEAVMLVDATTGEPVDMVRAVW